MKKKDFGGKKAVNRKSEARRRMFFFCCLLSAAFCLLSACGNASIPNLEPAECTDARAVVREFYSYHFGNDMKFSRENLRLREKYLSNELKESLNRIDENSVKEDVFTKNEDLPKAFRVGACKVIAPNKTELQILLFWKDDVRSEQREIKVEAVKENDKWVINKIL